MSAKPSPLLKPEVAPTGVVKIPKSVFESLPPPVTASGSDSNGVIKAIKRLDGSIDTDLGSKITPNNPNFAPRQAWPGGNIVTSNKDEALIKYHERKGIPLTPELEEKKKALEAEAKEKKAGIFNRLGNKAGGGGGGGGGGKVVKLGGAEGAFSKLGSDASGLPKSKKFSAAAAAPEAAPAAARPPRPKGGVKMLGGVEGAMRGEKRPADEEGGADAKRPAA